MNESRTCFCISSVLLPVMGGSIKTVFLAAISLRVDSREMASWVYRWVFYEYKGLMGGLKVDKNTMMITQLLPVYEAEGKSMQ